MNCSFHYTRFFYISRSCSLLAASSTNVPAAVEWKRCRQCPTVGRSALEVVSGVLGEMAVVRLTSAGSVQSVMPGNENARESVATQLGQVDSHEGPHPR